MLTVEDYARIRRAYRDGMSVRAIARRFHHSRRKIREVLREPEPKGYTRRKPVAALKLDPVKPIVDQILAEDEDAPRKQRHTAAQIFRRLVARFVEHYNTVRLHSAIGYVTPADKLFGLQEVIHAERDRKLEEARETRRQKRQAARENRNHSTQTKAAGGWPGRLDFRRLRREVSIAEVLKHLGYLDRMRGSGPQRRGPCPLHGSAEDRHRSFSVNLHKGVFRCFHPPCQAAGNTLDLWAGVHRMPIDQAARHLAETLAPGLTINPKPVTEKRNP